MDEMSSALDQKLNSGSLLRCICPICCSPRAVSARLAKCHKCQSNHELWYKKVGGIIWTKPRAPPPDVKGRFILCKHYVIGKSCVKTPCSFAHGQDEIDIWDIWRNGGRRSPGFLLCRTKSCHVARYSLLITHYSLLITHCSLLIAHYSLLIVHHSLLITHYSLLVTRYSLLVTRSSFVIPHSSLLVKPVFHFSRTVPYVELSYVW